MCNRTEHPLSSSFLFPVSHHWMGSKIEVNLKNTSSFQFIVNFISYNQKKWKIKSEKRPGKAHEKTCWWKLINFCSPISPMGKNEVEKEGGGVDWHGSDFLLGQWKLSAWVIFCRLGKMEPPFSFIETRHSPPLPIFPHHLIVSFGDKWIIRVEQLLCQRQQCRSPKKWASFGKKSCQN